MAWSVISLSILLAQGTRPTVAVLDFEGRGISANEVFTLTERLRTEIANTGAVLLVERKALENILREQGLQQSGCTTAECAVEVGQLLGVQFMINGVVGKVGSSYTIDARMFSVGSGAAERTKSITYTGAVDGLITEIEILAWNMVNRKVPKKLLTRRRGGVQVAGGEQEQVPTRSKSRFGALVRSTFIPGFGQFYSDRNLWGTLWLISELGVAGLAYSSYTEYQASYDDYDNYLNQYRQATDPAVIADFKAKAQASHADLTSANDQLEMLIYAGAGIWAVNMLHAVIFGPRESSQASRTGSIHLAYDPDLNQPQLRISIDLD